MDYNKEFGLDNIKYFCEVDETEKVEQWKDVMGYEGSYQVSDLGRIKSLSRIILRNGKYPFKSNSSILKGALSNHGYLKLTLSKNKKVTQFLIHQLVAIAFVGHKINGYKFVVNHKNFNRLDNRAVNLETTTQRENANQKHFKSSSKYVGVCWSKRHKKWRADITFGRTHKYLGYFHSELEAHKAYQNELRKINSKKK